MNNNNWLDIDVLEDYLDGKLDAKAMHRVERLSLEDPFVAEALAGLSLSPKRVQSLSLLQKQLQDRIAQKPIAEKRWRITSQRLSIAAAAAVLFVTVSLLFWMRESNNREELATNTPKKVEVAIAAVETSKAPGVKTKEEVEKVITATKNNGYANRTSAKTPIAAVMQTPIATGALTEEKEASLVQSKPALAVLPNQIKGVVIGVDKQPIPGALVKLKGASTGAITDRKGQFNLILDSLSKNSKLSIASLGYTSKEVSAKTDQSIAIELKPDNASLNEVVITGYGTAKKVSMSASSSSIQLTGLQPIGGWDKFEEYVVNNNKLLKDKKLTGRYVTVQFKLGENGEPIDIKVVGNFNMIPKQTEAEEAEAIRLVKNGPKWFLPPNSGSSLKETSVNIRF